MNFVYFGAVEEVSAGGSKDIAEANSATSSTHNSAEEIFPKMNHGQLLIDNPDEVARRIDNIVV